MSGTIKLNEIRTKCRSRAPGEWEVASLSIEIIKMIRKACREGHSRGQRVRQGGFDFGKKERRYAFRKEERNVGV